MKESFSQAEICEKYGSLLDPPGADQRLGIALSTLGLLPLNALRHQAENGTCGWYIWGGELLDASDFFAPLHFNHLAEYAPALIPFMGLSPGWRVLLAPGQTDVWYDPALLSV